MNKHERISYAAEEARRKLGITMVALAERLGISRGTLYQWGDGRISKPDADKLELLANLAGISVVWLKSGRGPIYIESGQKRPLPGADARHRVPLIDWKALREGTTVSESTTKTTRFIPTDAEINEDCFAIEVATDALDRPGDPNSIPPGMNLIMDPHSSAVQGSVVLAKFSPESEPVLRRWIVEGDAAYLKAANPDYKTNQVDDDTTILAVAIEVSKALPHSKDNESST